VKAIVVRETGLSSVLAIETVDDPAPAPNDVVIQVAACGVCFHDVVTRNGTLKAGVSLPFIPGHEVAGTVVAVGRAVTAFRPGDRVATTQRSHICGHCRYCRSNREPLCAEARFLGDAGLNGGYAEYVAVEADNLALIPEGVPFEGAAIAACAVGTGYHALRAVAEARMGDTVLITGAGGGVGIHAVQMARAAGARVIGQTTSAAKVSAIRDAGAHDVVCVGKGVDFATEIRARTGGIGVDIAIDTVGTPVFHSTRKSLAPAGRWILVGQLTGDFVPFNPAQLFLRGQSMLSATSTTREELRETLALIGRGAIRPVVSGKLPLDRAAEAHAAIESGQTIGRIVLTPT
jgi:D-arabinose 1-dehydrogenase-like Zn-dependent alcohol dehydrogenase